MTVDGQRLVYRVDGYTYERVSYVGIANHIRRTANEVWLPGSPVDRALHSSPSSHACETKGEFMSITMFVRGRFAAVLFLSLVASACDDA